MKTQTEPLEDTIETIGPERHPNFYAPRLTAGEMREIIWALRRGDPGDTRADLPDRLQVMLNWEPEVDVVRYENQSEFNAAAAKVLGDWYTEKRSAFRIALDAGKEE